MICAQEWSGGFEILDRSAESSKDIASHVTFLFIKPRSINPQFKAATTNTGCHIGRSHVLLPLALASNVTSASLSGHVLATSSVVSGCHLNCHMFLFFKCHSTNVLSFTCSKPLYQLTFFEFPLQRGFHQGM